MLYRMPDGDRGMIHWHDNIQCVISLVLKSICSIDHKRGPGIPCLTMHEAHVELCWCDN